MNHVDLTACIVERKALRYTPAGLPALDLVLQHASDIQDGHSVRQVKLNLKAQAFGVLAETLGQQAIGSGWRFSGFLASPRTGQHAVLQIQAIQPL